MGPVRSLDCGYNFEKEARLPFDHRPRSVVWRGGLYFDHRRATRWRGRWMGGGPGQDDLGRAANVHEERVALPPAGGPSGANARM